MSDLEQIKFDLNEVWNKFEEEVEKALSSDNKLLNTINSYLLSNSGKKIRSVLALLVSQSYPQKNNHLPIVCAAVAELIHTATLLHDDVVDDSDMRRGVSTVKSLFSPGASVLMGDYWLSKAIHLLIENRCDYDVLKNFSSTIEDLAKGEMLQMERADDLLTTEEDYYEIIRCKTASLFISTIKSAAQISKFPINIINAFEEYAYNLGITFQIRDDIIDYQSSSITGKDTDSDISERKITLPLFGAVKNNPSINPQIHDYLSKIDILKGAKDSENKAIVSKVKKLVLENDGIDYAILKLRVHIEKAKAALLELPDSIAKSHLIRIVSSLDIVNI